MRRREVLRLLSVSAVASLGAACQLIPPPLPAAATPPTTAATGPTLAPTPLPTAVPPPTISPTEIAAMPAIRLALDLDPDTLDPAGQTTPSVASIVDHLAETLVRLQPDGTIAPGLARKIVPAADGKSFTFELRPDVEFHDGSLLSSEAVALSLQRFLNPALRVPIRAPFDVNLIDSIVPLDPLSLRITLKDTSRLFLQKLAATELAIVSPAHARDFRDSFNEEPVGTGPYRFKERRKGESVVLERFERYWGKRPHYPQLQFRIVPEVATRESLLLANQVEFIVQPPASDLPALQKNVNLKVLQTPTARSTFVALDLTLPTGTPLAIKKVRQALNYAVDREGIIRNVLFGAATPLDSPLTSPLVGYTRIGGYSFDPNRARQLLLEGGTPRLQLRFLHATGRSVQDALAAQLAQAIAGNLREVGVDTDLVGADWPSFLAAVSVPEDKGTAHMHLFNWAPTLLDASQQMTQFVRSHWPPQGLATSHYWNPKVELAVGEAARERDDQKRLALYAEAQKIVWDEAPWIFLWSPAYVTVSAARLTGITAGPTEKFWAAYVEPA